MRRPTIGVGHKPSLWLLFIFRLRKCLKLRYVLIVFFCLTVWAYLRSINPRSSNRRNDDTGLSGFIPSVAEHFGVNELFSKCNFDDTESLLRYKSPQGSTENSDDTRPAPSTERLHRLFSILISQEEKLQKAFDYLGIFRFTNLQNTLRPFANNTQRLHEIFCLFQRYITISDNGHIDIAPQLTLYFKQVSTYLSDGFHTEHSTWKNQTLMKNLEKPVIILAANSRFYDTLQASMRTVNEYFGKHQVAIYDLGFDQSQLNMIKENCERCMIIPFPFAEIESVAPHIRNLPNFAWKPVVVQDAVRRFGTIMYGDTSVRYLTSDFDRIIIDNLIRGFACRELPGHYLPCFTLMGTFSWFNESYSAFDDVYIAEAGFVAVTDNFLSRLVLKTWVSCALDGECISPSKSTTQCKRSGSTGGTHRYDQSAMVAVLSFFFFQSVRTNDQTEPAPYDMFASIQQKVAEVRRFEGDSNYFTHKKDADVKPNNLTLSTTIKAS